jgi:4-amino-4-deoxy-L-arabinose transferase-like glycosyltransferase
VPDAWIDAVLVALAALAIATFAIVAFLRLGFPFELEWMEGSSIAHLDRVAHGLPLYVKPSIDFTPFIYPPLYFVVASWVAKLTGVGFVPLRLVSILASLGTMALLYWNGAP